LPLLFDIEAMASTSLILMLACIAPVTQATSMEMEHRANPIRKVVTMLQKMTSKVEAHGEAEKKLYDKFMCYCETGDKDLVAAISAAETKIPQLESKIKEGKAELAQLKEDLETENADRAAAKKAMAEATALRHKEKEAFDKESSELTADITAAKGATVAIEKGLSTGFLQTRAAENLRRLVREKSDLLQDADRDTLSAFLSMKDGSPGSDEIVGILQEMTAEMSKVLSEITAAEEESVKSYDTLMAAKTKEVKALTKSIETKMARAGVLAVENVEVANDLTDTEEGLAEDKKMLATLKKSCSTRTAEFEKEEKYRQEEIVALAETIKVLNDDDALDLFKKTLPSASSFMQIQVSAKSMRAKALAIIKAVPHRLNRNNLDFIALALRGKKIGFEKVTGMIDEMVESLKKEQGDDDSKKQYCMEEFDKSDDKKKSLEHSIKDLDTEMEDTSEAIETVTEEIEGLTAGIKALDKAVAEATEQRKEEHADYVDLMANDGAAKEVLGFAKNRLNKFYNPKMYMPPPKREMSREDQITVNMGGTLAPTAAPGGIGGTGIAMPGDLSFVQVQMHSQEETPVREESNGVIAMIDILVKDLDKEMTEAETSEKDAQADYEEMMKTSTEKRAEDSKALENKEAAKADMLESMQKLKDEKKSDSKSLAATIEYIGSLHSECDWLLQYFEVRKEARGGEVDALEKAKAVLAGADYSLLQTKRRKHLRHA
jgi:predicted  nucleic acid-binding Zn-ribbon protein